VPENGIDPENWLENGGICFFTGPAANLPSDIRIAAPDLGVLDLIEGLIIKNPDGPGIKTVAWKTGEPLPDKIMGIVADVVMIKTLLSESSEAIQLKSPNGNRWISLDEWQSEFGTNGFALIARMRLFWNQHGGGVRIGKPVNTGSGKNEIKKLGKW
jgi:hypothetical protein